MNLLSFGKKGGEFVLIISLLKILKILKKKFSLNKINYPFLLRVNNSVSGEDTVLVKKEIELNNALNVIEKSNRNRIGINRKMMCIEFINTIDNKRNVNVSYRIHVAGIK